MADFYADSSALVKRHIAERGTGWFQALAAPTTGNTIVTARISMVEVYSALNRRLREATLDQADYTHITADFDALCAAQYTLVELSRPVIGRARQLLEPYPLRAFDAIQLASALIVHEALAAAALPPLTFLSADQHLLQAALAEGLASDNPNTHP